MTTEFPVFSSLFILIIKNRFALVYKFTLMFFFMLRQYLSNNLSARLVCTWWYKVVGAVISLSSLPCFQCHYFSSPLSFPPFFLFLFSFSRDQCHCNMFPFKRALNGGGVGLVLLLFSPPFLTSPFLFHFRDLQTRTTWQFISTSTRWHWNLAQPEPTRSSLQVFAAPKSHMLCYHQTVKINSRSKCPRSCTPFLLSRPLLWSAFNQE